MVLFIFLFWMIVPAFSMDDDEDLDAEEVAALQASLLEHYQALNPHVDPIPAGVDDDLERDYEEQMRIATDLSLQEHHEKLAAVDNEQPKPLFEELVQKGKTSGSEIEFLGGLDSKNSIINLIGYMVFLNQQNKGRFAKLMNEADKGSWNDVYQKLTLGKRTANNVFILLDEAKKVILKQSAAYVRELVDLVDQIDHVMLELLSGKWGFSKNKLADDIKDKLKSAAVGIGRNMGNKETTPADCGVKIFQYFDKGLLVRTVTDPLLRKHRLSAFAYVADGYREGLIPDLKAPYAAKLAEYAQVYFSPEDLKGLTLEALIQEPKETLAKIARVSTISFAQQTAFDKLVGPLKTTIAAAELVKLKAFLGNFDPGNIYEILENEDQLNSLKLFQRALQDKTRGEIEAIINSLIASDLLPAEAEDVQDLLVEAAHYSDPPSIDKIYTSSMQALRLTGNRAAEPLIGSSREDLDMGLQLWILEYFKTIHTNGYYPRDACIVNHLGMLEGKIVAEDTEITESEKKILDEHMPVYVLANQLRESVFPVILIGQKTVLSLTLTGAKVDVVNEADGRVLRTGNVANIYADQIAMIRAKVILYGINPNVLPASAEKIQVLSDRAKKIEYAIRGGQGVSPLQKIQSRGRVIDALIKETRISRSLKLPILLYLDNW